jgi:ATP-dependent DNA helicase HFM1/MER3
VHILNENRGSVLEVVIARMKTRGTAVRFVMVSATVPNIEDVANWIRSADDNSPAVVFQVNILTISRFRPLTIFTVRRRVQ